MPIPKKPEKEKCLSRSKDDPPLTCILPKGHPPGHHIEQHLFFTWTDEDPYGLREYNEKAREISQNQARRIQQEARRRSKANGTKYTAELREVRKENGLDPTTGLPVE